MPALSRETITAPNSTTFHLAELLPGAKYRFRLAALNNEGYSAYTDEAVIATIPVAPGELWAKAISPTQIDLSWQDVSGEDEYQVLRSGDGGQNWQSLGTTQSASFSDTACSEGATYVYKVRASNASGQSGYSPDLTATALAEAPSELTATLSDAVGVTLTWTHNAAHAGTFIIERALPGENFAVIDTIAANPAIQQVEWTVAGVENARYHVRLRNDGGFSGYSNTATATYGPSAIAPPTNLQVSYLPSGEAFLTWDDPSEGEDYFVLEAYSPHALAQEWTMVPGSVGPGAEAVGLGWFVSAIRAWWLYPGLQVRLRMVHDDYPDIQYSAPSEP